MKNPGAIVVFLLAVLLAACGTPRAQKLPSVELDCRVVDVEGFRPIEGAELVWSYVGPSGERVDFGPFRTDRDGVCRVSVPAQELRPKHAIDYMAGGFFREVRVSASGFEAGRWRELDLHERVDASSIRPIEFRLRKKPNGSATDTVESESTARVVVGIVSSYDQLVALSHGDRGPSYCSRLHLIAPAELAGRVMTVASPKPLSTRHPLTQVGAAVEMRIDGLEEYRGVEYAVEPSSAVVLYSIPFSAIVVAQVVREPSLP